MLFKQTWIQFIFSSQICESLISIIIGFSRTMHCIVFSSFKHEPQEKLPITLYKIAGVQLFSSKISCESEFRYFRYKRKPFSKQINVFVK